MTKNETDGLVQQISDAFMREIAVAWPSVRAARDAGNSRKAEKLTRRALDKALPAALSTFDRLTTREGTRQ